MAKIINTSKGLSPRGQAIWLKALHEVFAPRLEERHTATQARRMYLNQIRDFAENGMIAIVESGMDCDGVQYSGIVYLVEANKAVIKAHIEHSLNWADGPMYFSLEKPSKAEKIEYASRDLGMEAHEDGHPHVLKP
jgi:hypothetical protein